MAQRFDPVYIGIKSTVLALDRASGETLWRRDLKRGDFVNVVVQDGHLFASARGEVFRLDPSTGEILWRNQLAGLGWGIVTIAGGPQLPAAAEKKRREQAAAAAAVSA